MNADMRFFILTGDKLESTIQIASAVNIINEKMNVITIKTTDRYLLDRTLTKLSDEIKANLESYHVDLEKLEIFDRVIAIDGPTLGMI
jgi:magnesium-transporting ATPase (P-type)